MRPPPVLLHVALALASVATLGGGLLAGADLRADARRAAALERDRVDLIRYQDALTPVAEAVFDLVQPLQQSFRDLAEGRVEAVDVLLEVAAHVAGEEGVGELRGHLRALEPADPVRGKHDALHVALEDLGAAARTIGALNAGTSATVDAEDVAKGDLALDAATRSWSGALLQVYGAAKQPPVPLEAGVAGLRAPRSQASYLREVGNLCSVGLDALSSAGADEPEPTAAQVRASAAELGLRLPQLMKVQPPQADLTLVTSSIRAPLEASGQVVSGVDRALDSVARGDAAGLRAARAEISRGEVAAEKAAAGFRAYGSQLCALYLVGDAEGDGSTLPAFST